MVQKSHKTR